MKLTDLHFNTPYLNLDSECYDLTDPMLLENPYLISYNPDAAALIDLELSKEDEACFVEFLNGSYLPKGATTFSMCYAGHQFGHFVPRLGDGRALNFGAVNGWNLQTKGSGETLYSRMGDGRAVLRSSIREYLMSEAMHHLGVPTTRALGIIGSSTQVLRDRIEKAAIVMRMSPSWVRFGTFEYFYYTGEHAKLEALADYVIQESYPHLQHEEDRYFKMFCEVMTRTAELIAQWQALGFNHGVMNTDNMSITGLTIDYGPYAMMDDFDYNFTCNKTDRAGRYAYDQQPNISYWNLTMLARALSPIVALERMEEQLKHYETLYPDAYVAIMRQKLGLQLACEEDVELITELVGTLHDVIVDYTLFFRTLSRYDGDRSVMYDIVMEPVILDKWLILYDARLAKETRSTTERHEAMLRTNPKYVLKNHMLQEAIDKAERGDFSMIEELLEIARNPYEELAAFERFYGDTPENHKNLRLSCSS